MTELNDALQNAFDEAGISDDDPNRHRLIKQFRGLAEEAYKIGDCDHEDVSFQINPETLSRPGGELLTNEFSEVEEGLVTVFKASCDDCPATLDAPLRLEVERP